VGRGVPDVHLYWNPRSPPGLPWKVPGIPISGMSGYRAASMSMLLLSVV
jgi:hypothetical protein